MQTTEHSVERQERLAEIKRQIDAGVYESPEKLRTAVAGLSAELESAASEPLRRKAPR